MKSEHNIILCAGEPPVLAMGYGASSSVGMVPINGKPAIGWILDDLLAKGLRQATVVVGAGDRPLRAFLDRAYSRRMDLSVAPVEHSQTILHSLQAGLEFRGDRERVRVILGDTLIPDRFDIPGNFAYVGEVEDSRRWCVAVVDHRGEIADYLDKQPLPYGAKHALAGYYQFENGALFSSCVGQAIADGGRELSVVLRNYGERFPISARLLRSWFDFGHIDKLVEARRALLKPRYFNSLKINPVLNTITKVSQNSDKLLDELDWYQELPEELKVLTPRLLSRPSGSEYVEITQEYYGYPTLSEMYVYANLDVDSWASIINHVLLIHAELRKYPGKVDRADFEQMYVVKTQERLNKLRSESREWARILEWSTLTVNGEELAGFPAIAESIWERAALLAKANNACIIHGDLCFSNMLYEPNCRIVRLIDPRGRFGKKKGIYGDPRYDAAKLRHSVAGLYDHVMADMFDLEEDGSIFRTQVYTSPEAASVGRVFDEMLVGLGYQLDEIRLIEGLLFLSMLPLHSDHPRRQKMLFLRGVELLNEVIV